MGKHPFKILCIDGGGIKGLFSAQILAKFEEVYDTKISEQFDLICGTSTGGIIALAASANISMSDVVNFYKEKGPKIFAQKRKKNLGKLWLKIKQICYKGKYSNEELRKASTGAQTFGGYMMPMLGNLSHMNYAVTCCVGGLMTIAGAFDLGSLVSYLQYTKQVSNPIAQVSTGKSVAEFL